MSERQHNKPLGFWTIWSLIAGIMIGSGIFLLPSEMAALGMISFAGWIFTCIGALLLGIVFARLARRTQRSGGVYIYAHDSFGDFIGFVSGWAYWCGYWISIPTLATAFVGYLTVFFPGLDAQSDYKLYCALALIWVLIGLNMLTLKGAGRFQLVTMVLKLLPLIIVIAAGFFLGSSDNLPPYNPGNVGF
ncbi:MAG: amino acid permease, partial [Hellea sp.]|nr:amino acid permease [Hellea sp.]